MQITLAQKIAKLDIEDVCTITTISGSIVTGCVPIANNAFLWYMGDTEVIIPFNAIRAVSVDV